MTPEERFSYALIRINNGDSIRQIIKTVFGNSRQYYKQLSVEQKARLRQARCQHLECSADPAPKSPPRLFIETTAERRQAVVDYCKTNNISIARFVNSAIADALNRVKS